jgi:hypothetical protein
MEREGDAWLSFSSQAIDSVLSGDSVRLEDSAGVIHGFVGLAIISRLLPLQGVVGGMISCAKTGKIQLLQRRMKEIILKSIRIAVTKIECFGNLPKR